MSDTKVQEDLKKADLITVTIGANDILNKFRELYQEVFDEDMKVRDIESILKIIQSADFGRGGGDYIWMGL